MKQQILDILQDYCADEAMTAEIKAVLDKLELPGAVSMLETKPVTQADIIDWATLNGYVAVKCNSMTGRLRVENVAREMWGEDYKKYMVE